MPEYLQYIIQAVAFVFGSGFIGFLAAVLTLRFRVKKEKEETKQEVLETEQKEIETKDIEFKSLKSIINGLQEEVKVLKTMCSECSYKSFYEMTERRLNEKINEKKS